MQDRAARRREREWARERGLAPSLWPSREAGSRRAA